jgi:hypothetical protein
LKLILSSPKNFDSTDNEIISIIEPVLNDCKVLLNVYDIDYKNEFSHGNDPRIIIAGLLLLTIEKEFETIENASESKYYNSFNMESSKGTWDCAMEAIGVAAISELIGAIGSTAAIQASKAVILKAVGKLASRYAGWIGAAVMVADFTECMITGD